MDYKRIKLDIRGDIAVLTLNHPETLNAISMDMLNELKVALTTVANPSSNLRCLLITGEGKGFSSTRQGRALGPGKA